MEKSLRDKLLSLARKVLENDLRGDGHSLEECYISEFEPDKGVFVTLKKHGELRGCIGRIEAERSLYQNVIELSQSAAFDDNRFSPLKKRELDDVKIGISILSPPREVQGKDSRDKVSKLRPGKDGVIISRGRERATFLPQVWKSLPGREEFMNNLCLKAGLSPDHWKENQLKISVYQVESFEEE